MRRKKLRFESLEKRQMLAHLGLQLLALENPDDETSTVGVLTPGEVFWLNVQAQDIRDDADVGEPSPGVISLPLDIQWPDLADPGDPLRDVFRLSFDDDVFPEPPLFPVPIPLENPVVTGQFPLQRYVDTIEPGSILSLRGGAIPLAGQGSAIGTGGQTAIGEWPYEEFSRWRFEAVGAGWVDVDVEPIMASLAGAMAFADGDALQTADPASTELQVQVRVPVHKFNDENENGIQDDGESGLRWEIDVFRDDDGNGLLNEIELARGPLSSESTDDDGDHVFQLGVGEPDQANPLGTTAHYVLVERSQSGWRQTSPDTNVWDGVDPAEFDYGEFGYAISVEVGDGNFGEPFDFGNVLVPPVGRSSLSGFAYVDGDDNGRRDLDGNGAPLELGIPNVTIHLDRSDGDGGWVEVAGRSPITTGKDGWYHFNDLEPGTYRVREDQPECFLDGRDSLGVVLEEEGDARETRGTVGQDELSDIALAAAEHGIDYNFGELGYRARCVNKRMFLTDPPIQEILCDRVGLECVTVRGTPEDNTIVFEATGSVLRVTVDDQAPQEYPIESVDILAIDAGAGTDTVVLNGGADTIAHVQPGMGVIRSSMQYQPTDYSAEALNAETIIVDGGGLAVLRDTPHDDLLVAEDSTATLTMAEADLVAVAMAYDWVHGLSAYAGDDDTVERVEPVSLDLLLIGDWRAV
jgi:SdrD B-like protein